MREKTIWEIWVLGGENLGFRFKFYSFEKCNNSGQLLFVCLSFSVPFGFRC
ncbi:hypothetical protein Syun_023433 [Stephania yunnanensis]|uniref:Uncharacterized protein n=1 Tax=Stephania yunnanensis TaxID=152371 RepID=A0AAP0FC72_9MAGN